MEKSKTMNLMSIEFNRDNQKAVEMKRVENLKILYESEILDYLHNEFLGCSIILFGSYSLGEDIIKSDIRVALPLSTIQRNPNIIKENNTIHSRIRHHSFYF